MKGVLLRQATGQDLRSIIELNRAGSGDDIAAEIEIVFRTGVMTPSDFAVAVVDDTVVATAGLLAAHLRVGSTILPVGQPEYIGTHRDYRGRGLAGRLLRKVQRWSDNRGDLVQIIGGVPYFYRRHGYSYGLVRSREILVEPEHPLVFPNGWTVRLAEPRDVQRLRALQIDAQEHADIALPFADNLWPAFLEMRAAPLLVGLNQGNVEAAARVATIPGSQVHVEALASSPTSSLEGLTAILAGVRSWYPRVTMAVADREGSQTRAVIPDATTPTQRKWLYVRVGSLTRLLSAIRTELDSRLAQSTNPKITTNLNISLYESSVNIQIDEGKVVTIRTGDAIHKPDGIREVGVPPDLIPRLLFGEGGAAALGSDPDVVLGQMGWLMSALFPPLRLDLLTW